MRRPFRLCLLLCALALTPGRETPADQTVAPSTPVVQVNFARKVAGVHSMVGFLHGCSDTTPADDRLLPLHPALWRIGYQWMSNRDRLAKLRVPTILILSDSWGSRVPKDGSEWSGYVHAMIRNAGGVPYTWDVMNEPDLSYSFQGTPAQFFEMYVNAEHVIHQQLGSQTPVSGPSISHYDPQFLTAFLDYCKAQGAHVDVLSWHELDDDTDEAAVAEHLQDARRRFLENPSYASLGIKKIEINEIIGPTAQYQPGDALAYFAALEQGGAGGACKGCWDDNCSNNTLDGLLTPDTHEPRAEWWAYKTYADSISRRVATQSSDSLVAAFGSSGDGASATVLIGHAGNAPSATVALQLTGLNKLSFVRAAQRVHVRVERIPDAGQLAVSQLPVVAETNVAVSQGAARLTLPPLASHEAEVVTLTKAPETP